MQLTTHTDYSLRVLLYLAQKGGKQATISEIADFYHISRNHLVKVVHHLAHTGFLNTVRGKHGGITLARAANSISVGDVVRQMEPHFDITECFTVDNQSCVIAPVCTLKTMLAQANNAFLSLLDGYTVADAVTQNEQAKQIFPVDQLLNSGSSEHSNKK